MLLKYELVGANAKHQQTVRLVAPVAYPWLRFLPVFRASAVLFLLVGLSAPTKVLAAPIVIGGTANPGRAYNAAHTLYVDAIPVTTAMPWLDYLPSSFQVIQNAMNQQLQAAGQPQNWPLPVQGSSQNVTFTVNTPPNPHNYFALNSNGVPTASLYNMTTTMPAGEHWLQLVHTNFLSDLYPPASVWADPSGAGYWLIDNNNTPGQPFYDLVPGSPATPPNFADGPHGYWDGTSYFHAYLFVAEKNVDNVITIHDGVYWGFDEPAVVPEPSALTLWGIGLLAVLLYGRHCKVAAQ